MCSRVAASAVKSTGFDSQMIVYSAQEYEDRAVHLAHSVTYDYLSADGVVLSPKTTSGDTASSDNASESNASESNTSGSNTSGDNTPWCTSSGGHTSRDTARGGIASGDKEASLTPADLQADLTSQYAVGLPAEMSATMEMPLDDDPEYKSLLEDSWLKDIRFPRAKDGYPPPGCVTRRGKGELLDLRRDLFLTRESSPLFDTEAWVRTVERGLKEAWRRWVAGTDVEYTEEYRALPPHAPEKISPHIWVDQEPRAF